MKSHIEVTNMRMYKYRVHLEMEEVMIPQMDLGHEWKRHISLCSYDHLPDVAAWLTRTEASTHYHFFKHILSIHQYSFDREKFIHVECNHFQTE